MDGRAYVYIMSTIFSQYFYNKFYVTGCYWWKKKMISIVGSNYN